MHSDGRSPLGAVAQAAVLLVAVAIAARVAYILLAPLLPALLAISVVMGVTWLIFRH
jgi:hypothetical protein